MYIANLSSGSQILVKLRTTNTLCKYITLIGSIGSTLSPSQPSLHLHTWALSPSHTILSPSHISFVAFTHHPVTLHTILSHSRAILHLHTPNHHFYTPFHTIPPPSHTISSPSHTIPSVLHIIPSNSHTIPSSYTQSHNFHKPSHHHHTQILTTETVIIVL